MNDVRKHNEDQAIGNPHHGKVALILMALANAAMAADGLEKKFATPSSADHSSVPNNAEKIVSRHEGVWTSPPKRVPTNEARMPRSLAMGRRTFK